MNQRTKSRLCRALLCVPFVFALACYGSNSKNNSDARANLISNGAKLGIVGAYTQLESLIASNNSYKSGSHQWHFKAAMDLMSVSNSLDSSIDYSVHAGLADLAVTHLTQAISIGAANSDKGCVANSYAQLGYINETVYANRSQAKAYYAQALQTIPNFPYAKQRYNRLVNEEAVANSRAKSK